MGPAEFFHNVERIFKLIDQLRKDLDETKEQLLHIERVMQVSEVKVDAIIGLSVARPGDEPSEVAFDIVADKPRKRGRPSKP